MEKCSLQDLRYYDESVITYIPVVTNKYGDCIACLRMETRWYPNVRNIYFGYEKPATYGEHMYQVLKGCNCEINFSHCYMKIGNGYWVYAKGDANLYKLKSKPEVFTYR